MARRPSRSPLFPYTTLFRSAVQVDDADGVAAGFLAADVHLGDVHAMSAERRADEADQAGPVHVGEDQELAVEVGVDRKSTRLNSSHANISYAVFCLKKKTEA